MTVPMHAQRGGETRTGLLVALFLMLAGLGLVVAGMAILLGLGWALVTGGVGLVVFALLANLSRVLP